MMLSSVSPTNDLNADRLREFDRCTRNAQIFLSIARDTTLQRAVIAELSDLATQVDSWKKEAVLAQIEDSANLFLGMGCAIQALASELDMWLLLKAGDPDNAWNKLIDAQMATLDALRAHGVFASFSGNINRLHGIERLVFPPQVFFSAGLIVESSFCSICGTEYGECIHVIGRPYMGQLCRRILKNVTPDHVAIVSEPANKRCRVVSFTSKDGKRNRMTWKLESPQDSSENEEENSLTAQGIIITASDFES